MASLLSAINYALLVKFVFNIDEDDDDDDNTGIGSAFGGMRS